MNIYRHTYTDIGTYITTHMYTETHIYIYRHTGVTGFSLFNHIRAVGGLWLDGEKEAELRVAETGSVLG